MKKLQPSWVAPLVGTTPLMGQFMRQEFLRQRVVDGHSVWNFGNNKGPGLILSSRIETDLSVPNYVVHGSAPGTDGVGDFCFSTRFRIASANKDHGNYSIAVVASETWPTGVAQNGAASRTRGITLTGGKAFGKFAALGSVGATLPTAPGLASMGRPVGVNSALEMHVTPRLWAQLETNTTIYNGGTHDGKRQNFLTPGVAVVPLKILGAESKTYLLIGVGMQFATTRYHGSDHNLIVDTKFYF